MLHCRQQLSIYYIQDEAPRGRSGADLHARCCRAAIGVPRTRLSASSSGWVRVPNNAVATILMH